jgi:hypothetical protein
MSDQSGTSVYIGAPDAFAEWLGYSVEELLDGPGESANGRATASPDDSSGQEESGSSSDESSGGFLKKLLGR